MSAGEFEYTLATLDGNRFVAFDVRTGGIASESRTSGVAAMSRTGHPAQWDGWLAFSVGGSRRRVYSQ